MICCGMEPIKNTALGKDFFVCRECKQEVMEETPEVAYPVAAMEIADGVYQVYRDHLRIHAENLYGVTPTKADMPALDDYYGHLQMHIDSINKQLADEMEMQFFNQGETK